MPTVLESVSYIFCFHGLMCGPFCFYKDYIAFIEGTNYMSKPAQVCHLMEIVPPSLDVCVPAYCTKMSKCLVFLHHYFYRYLFGVARFRHGSQGEFVQLLQHVLQAGCPSCCAINIIQNKRNYVQVKVRKLAMSQCFSIAYRRTLVSKSFVGPLVLSKKLNCVRHLWPLDAFSRLLVGPKCISACCSSSCTPNPHWGSIQHSHRLPSWWGGGSLAPCPRTFLLLLAFGLEFRSFGLRSPPKRHRFREQSKLL